jgi:hypothetical protein
MFDLLHNIQKRSLLRVFAPGSPAYVESRTSKVLQEMFEAHRPSAWYFGHFHINREFLIGKTTFRCLGEMAVYEVPEPAFQACGL